MPQSRPMFGIGPSCHELRIADDRTTWRIVYFVGATAVLVLDVFEKKTRATPSRVIDGCRRRLGDYLAARLPER
jgi:phage-related protein